MIEIPVVSANGEKVDTLKIDEAWFGGRVRKDLLRRAVLMHEANQRVGTAATKSRGMIAGSTRKIFRQKGTGRARMGPKRSPIRRGGGVTFAKVARSFRQRLPKRARRAALDSALLAKFLDGETLVLDKIELKEPKTREIVSLLSALKVNGIKCLFAIKETDEIIWKSARNLPKLTVLRASDLNTYEVLKAKRVLFLREAIEALIETRKS